MAFFEDGSEFIDDFAEEATFKGNSVNVILDKTIFFGQDVEQSRPMVIGAYSDLSEAVEGDVLIIRNKRYEVMSAPLSDAANAITTLVLRYA